MALVSVIRRWYFREGISIREITPRTQLSRNTIRKYLLDRGDLTVDKGRFVLTTTGEMTFNELGIDVSKLRSGRRMLVRGCPDWTESEHHLGGALGAALFGRFRELGWLVASRKSLDVKLTETGRDEIYRHFGDVIRTEA